MSPNRIQNATNAYQDSPDNYLLPGEENVQKRKVSQRELSSLGSVNANGLLESGVSNTKKPRPSLKSLKIKYEVFLQDVLEKELYVPDKRQDPILPIMETSIKCSFQAYKSFSAAWTNITHELAQVYLSQGASEEAREVNNRIGSVNHTVTLFQERFEDILSVTDTWNPRAGSHHSRSLSRASNRSLTPSQIEQIHQLDKQKQIQEMARDLESEKAKQAKLQEAEAQERTAQEAESRLQEAKRNADKLRREAVIAGKEAALRATTVLLERLDENLSPCTLNSSFSRNTPISQPPEAAFPEISPLAPVTIPNNENSSDKQWSLTSMMSNQITTVASIHDPPPSRVTFDSHLNSGTNIDTNLSNLHLNQRPDLSTIGASIPPR